VVQIDHGGRFGPSGVINDDNETVMRWMTPRPALPGHVIRGHVTPRDVTRLQCVSLRSAAAFDIITPSIRLPGLVDVRPHYRELTAEGLEQVLAWMLPSTSPTVSYKEIQVSSKEGATLWNSVSTSGLKSFATAGRPSKVLLTFIVLFCIIV